MEALHNLGINPLMLVGQVVNFLILLIIFKKFLYKPILGMLERREIKVKESIEKADKIDKEYTTAEQTTKEKIANAAKESQAIVVKAKENAEETRKEILAKSHGEAEEILEKTREEIRVEKERILREVRQETATLATLVSSQILQKDLDENMQRQLVDDAIAQIDSYYQSTQGE